MELRQHTMRCPLEECSATVTVRTDPGGYPSSRHLDVTVRPAGETGAFAGRYAARVVCA